MTDDALLSPEGFEGRLAPRDLEDLLVCPPLCWAESSTTTGVQMTTTTSSFLAAVPALPVSDERRAVAFLEGALGFTELLQDGKGLGILRRDEVEVHVWVADGSAKGAERHLAGSASCRIEVTGVDELYEHCRRLDVVHPNAPLRNEPWGSREFSVLDPDNNLIALYERISPTAFTTGNDSLVSLQP